MERSRVTMPNFLIIGAARAGTTSLWYYLRQHPQIFMSAVKEPNFFGNKERRDYRGPGDQKWRYNPPATQPRSYASLFDAVRDERAIGEATPGYLHNRACAERIRARLPDVRLIAILRDPAERALSQYLYMRREGAETLTDFAQALDAEEQRTRENWSPMWRYADLGFYHLQLSHYLRIFDRQQIGIFYYEDLDSRPIELLQAMFRFLDVDPSFVPDVSTRHNKAGVPKSLPLLALLRKRSLVRPLLDPLLPERWRRKLFSMVHDRSLTRPSLRPELRRRLVDLYRSDLTSLQELLERDLSAWLRSES